MFLAFQETETHNPITLEFIMLWAHWPLLIVYERYFWRSTVTIGLRKTRKFHLVAYFDLIRELYSARREELKNAQIVRGL